MTENWCITFYLTGVRAANINIVSAAKRKRGERKENIGGTLVKNVRSVDGKSGIIPHSKYPFTSESPPCNQIHDLIRLL